METAGPQPAQATCARCRRTTIVPQLLTQQARSFSLAPIAWLCPRCAASERTKSLIIVFAFNLTALLILLVAGWCGKLRGDLPALASFLAAAVIVEPLSMVLHEAAHAAVGALVGLRVFGVTLGSGPRIARLSFRRFFIEIRLIPYGGLCHSGAKPQSSQRWRLAASVLAGPMVHLLAIAALLAYAAAVGFDSVRWPPTNWWWLAMGVSTLMLIQNLYPRTFQRDGWKLNNDGMQFLLFVRSKQRAAAWIAANNEFEISAALEAGRPHDAQALIEQARPLLGNNLNFRITELNVLASCGKWPEVHARAVQNLSGKLPPLFRQPFAAWAAVASVYTHGNLDSAALFSEEALSVLPWDPATLTVGATVSLAQGRIDESERFLQQAGWRGLNRTAKAAGAWVRCAIFHARGQSAQRDKWQARARAIDTQEHFRIPPSPPQSGRPPFSELFSDPPEVARTIS